MDFVTSWQFTGCFFLKLLIFSAIFWAIGITRQFSHNVVLLVSLCYFQMLLNLKFSIFKFQDGDVRELERTKQYVNEAFQAGAMTCLICIASVKRNQAVSFSPYLNYCYLPQISYFAFIICNHLLFFLLIFV